jgi:HEAT repeat protein
VVEDVAEMAAVELNLGKGSKAESDPLVYVNLVLQEGKAGTGEGSGEGEKAGEGQAAAPPAHAAAVRKVFGDIEQMAQEDRAAVARELSENKAFPWSKEALELLCEMVYLENEPAGVAETVNILDKILDELVTSGKIQPTAQMIAALRQMVEDFRNKSPEWVRPIQAALDKAGDPIRLSKMNELLNANKVDDPEAVAHYLRTLDWKSVGNIHALLGTLEHYPHRKLICQVLEQMGSPAVELIAKGMADPRWFVVRNTAMILGHIGGDKACQHLRAGLSHSDVRVRRETLMALEQIGTPTASKMVLSVLNEKDGKLRSKALQILVHLQEAEACKPLWERIESKDFFQWSPEEQRELLCAYAQIGRDRVLEELAGLVTRQAFFKRGLYQPIKEFAVEAMAKVGTPRAQEYLERLAGTTSGSLKTACQTWAQRLKRRQVQGVVPAKTGASRGDEDE